MKKAWKAMIVAVVLVTMVTGALVAAGAQEAKDDGKMVFGYITPGPDTWYKMGVDGFVWAAERAGVEVQVLNSDYDPEREIANIESFVDRGVDGLAVFSFNPQGANLAARRAGAAGIPVVAIDNAGQVLLSDNDVVAAVDFDWVAMGKNIANYMAENYPGDNIAFIGGLFEHVPVQMFRSSFEPEVERLGKNKITALRDGRYDPSQAVSEVEDLIQAGVDFQSVFVFNEEMGAAVVRTLENRGLLNNPIKVISSNGAPYGIELIKEGKIDYSISTSPGWEGMIAFLELYSYVTGRSDALNRQIMLPDTPITPETINDKTKVVPWEPDPVWLELTKTYFPEYDGLY